MKTSKAIGIATAILFAALWALPLFRAISFYRDSQAYYFETNSADAQGDVSFSKALVFSYVLSMLAAFAFAWLVSRRPRLALLFPAGLLAFAVLEVLRLHPECPIVFFPTMMPLHPALISLAAVVVAFFIHVLRRAASAETPG